MIYIINKHQLNKFNRVLSLLMFFQLSILGNIFSQEKVEINKLSAEILKKYTIEFKIGKDSTNEIYQAVKLIALKNQFTNLISGKSTSSIGTYASYSSLGNELVYNQSVISKAGNIYEFNIGGGTDEKILAVFNSSKLNSNISIGAKANIFLDNSSNSKSTLYNSDFKKHLKKINFINLNFIKDSLNAETTIANSRNKILCIQKKIAEKVSEIHNKIIEIEAKKDTTEPIKDLLNVLTRQAQYYVITYKSYGDSLSLLGNAITYIKNLNKIKDEDIEKVNNEVPNVPLTKLHLSWLTFGFNYKPQNFNLFDPTLKFEDQVFQKHFNGLNARIQYSNYQKISTKKRYFNIGLLYSVSNNLGDYEINKFDTQLNYPNNSNIDSTLINKKYIKRYSTRTFGKTISAYDDSTYSSHNNNLKIYSDVIFSIKNATSALRFSPEIILRRDSYIANLSIGYIYQVFDAEKTNRSNINIELYYNLNNISDSINNKGFLKNNEIGLRFGIPINLIPSL